MKPLLSLLLLCLAPLSFSQIASVPLNHQVSNPRFSPDGELIAFTDSAGENQGALYLMDRVTGKLMDVVRDFQHTISPGPGEDELEIFVNKMLRLLPDFKVTHYRFSPDGRQLAFSCDCFVEGLAYLYLFDLTTHQLRRVSSLGTRPRERSRQTLKISNFDFSPNGEHLVVQSDAYSKGVDQLYRVHLESGDALPLIPMGSQHRLRLVEFSPDGNFLLFVASERMKGPAHSKERMYLFDMNHIARAESMRELHFSPNLPKPLSHTTLLVRAPRFSSDGRTITFHLQELSLQNKRILSRLAGPYRYNLLTNHLLPMPGVKNESQWQVWGVASDRPKASAYFPQQNALFSYSDKGLTRYDLNTHTMRPVLDFSKLPVGPEWQLRQVQFLPHLELILISARLGASASREWAFNVETQRVVTWFDEDAVFHPEQLSEVLSTVDLTQTSYSAINHFSELLLLGHRQRLAELSSHADLSCNQKIFYHYLSQRLAQFIGSSNALVAAHNHQASLAQLQRQINSHTLELLDFPRTSHGLFLTPSIQQQALSLAKLLGQELSLPLAANTPLQLQQSLQDLTSEITEAGFTDERRALSAMLMEINALLNHR